MRRDIDLSVSRPTVQVSDIAYNGGVLSWVRGNGEFLVVCVSRKPIEEFIIRDIFTAEIDTSYRNKRLDKTPYLVVYKGTGTEVELDLPIGTYYVNAFEFNGENSVERYHIERNEVQINVGLYFITGAINALKGLVNGLLDYVEPVTYEISGAVTALMGQVSGNLTWEPTIHEISGDIQGLMGEVTGDIVDTTIIGITNSSLDIIITDVWVNGVPADFVSGSLPCGPGSGCNMSTKITGNHTIAVFYGTSIGGQKIRVTDSSGAPQCQPNSASPNAYPACDIIPGLPISIEAEDGAC